MFNYDSVEHPVRRFRGLELRKVVVIADKTARCFERLAFTVHVVESSFW